MKRYFSLQDLLKVNGKKDESMGMPFPCLYFDGQQAIAATTTMTIAIDCPQPTLGGAPVVVATTELEAALMLSPTGTLDLQRDDEGLIANGLKVSAYSADMIQPEVLSLLQLDRAIWRMIVPTTALDGMRWPQLVSSMATRDVRFYLNGAFVDVVNGALVSTDGHRLHMVEDVLKPAPQPLPEEGLQGVVLPGATVRFLARVGGVQQMFVLEHREETSAKPGAPRPRLACFMVANARIRCRALDTLTYPNYRQFFEADKAGQCSLILTPSLLREVLKVAKVAAKGLGGQVTLVSDGRLLSLSAGERLEQHFQVPSQGGPFSITVQSAYLAEALTAASVLGATVHLRVEGWHAKGLCVDSQDFHAVVMGVSRQSEVAEDESQVGAGEPVTA